MYVCVYVYIHIYIERERERETQRERESFGTKWFDPYCAKPPKWNPKFEILPNESLAQTGSSSTGLAVRSFDMVTSPALKTLNRKLNLKPSISKPQLSRDVCGTRRSSLHCLGPPARKQPVPNTEGRRADPENYGYLSWVYLYPFRIL